MPEYLAELVFDKWAKKTELGTIISETNDDNKMMAEIEKAIGKMKIGEETASSNTGDLKAIAKGKRKMGEMKIDKEKETASSNTEDVKTNSISKRQLEK
jgi:hypothetical protein